jgi:hypothetical protein
MLPTRHAINVHQSRNRIGADLGMLTTTGCENNKVMEAKLGHLGAIISTITYINLLSGLSLRASHDCAA